VFISLSLELRLILAIFTCYRLARLVAKDDGPLFLFEFIRQWAGMKADSENYNLGKWHNLSEALSCPYCLGVWFSIPMFLFVIYPMTLTDLFMLLMAISGVQAWLWGMTNK
jgi:hypothetical protein